jgi:hypothetical protein
MDRNRPRPPEPRIPLRPWQIWLAGALLVTGAFVLLSLGLRNLGDRLAADEVFAVLVNQQRLLLDGETLRAFDQELSGLSGQQLERVSGHLRHWVDRQVDEAFALAIGAVPGYLDWYYSLPGSYTRLYLAVYGQLETGVQEQMYRQLFAASGMQGRLEQFEDNFSREIEGQLQGVGDALRAQLAERYQDFQTEQEVGSGGERQLDFDRAIELAFSPGREDIQRWQAGAQAAGVTGAGSLALLSRRAILPRLIRLPAVQTALQGLARHVAALAPRLSAAIGAGGKAAVVAAPTGPGAVLTFVAAAGTFVAADFALLKTEENRLRAGHEEELVRELAASREATRGLLQAQLDLVLAEADAHYRQALVQPYEMLGAEERFRIFNNKR